MRKSEAEKGKRKRHGKDVAIDENGKPSMTFDHSRLPEEHADDKWTALRLSSSWSSSSTVGPVCSEAQSDRYLPPPRTNSININSLPAEDPRLSTTSALIPPPLLPQQQYQTVSCCSSDSELNYEGKGLYHPSPRLPFSADDVRAGPAAAGRASMSAYHCPSLSPPSLHPRPPQLPRQHRGGGRRSSAQPIREDKAEMVPVVYPWATAQRATVRSLEELEKEGINEILGEVVCRRCEKKYEMGFDLKQESLKIFNFIAENKAVMNDQAPSVWATPALPACLYCQQDNAAKPVIADKKKAINWLFLLLGQLLGCCTLEQLKYFCKHTRNHRTGAKDRVLYLTYLALCKQLDPTGPFDPLQR